MDEKAGASSKPTDKGSLNHLTHQLKKTPEQHFSEIAHTIALAKAVLKLMFIWKTGMECRNSPDYVFQYLDFLQNNQLKESYYQTL
jgi:D-citramalate synthase